uniref:Uncharacterized protein n=1 Tax=Avena sativa TaxID=4498 RepID=A0ACD5TU30_AVESA
MMDSILEAYGDDSPKSASCEQTEVIYDDYCSQKSPSCVKTDVICDDYCSIAEDPHEEVRCMKHTTFHEDKPRNKKAFVYDAYYTSEDESSEEESSLRDARFDKALLNFYVKNKVKQLKRKLTSCRVDKFKRTKPNIAAPEITQPTIFTRYSGTYFSSVVKQLTPHQISVITQYGAQCLLKFEKTDVPLRFVKWIASKFDTRTSEIQVNKEFIAVTEETMHHILGLPIGGLDLVSDSQAGRNFILSHFNVTCIPQVSYFGNKLKSGEDLSDDDIFICFMAVAFQSFLCPNSSLQPSSDYLTIFSDPKSMMRYNLSKYVYNWLINSIKKFQKCTKLAARRQITLGGNHYSLAVAYLDRVEFGPISLPSALPRVLVWKGSRIRRYSELDKCSGNSYGKRTLKHFSYADKIQGEHPCDKGRSTIPVSNFVEESFNNKCKSTIPDSKIVEDCFNNKLTILFSSCLNDEQIQRIKEIVNNKKDSLECCENAVLDVLKTICIKNSNGKSDEKCLTPNLDTPTNNNDSPSNNSFDVNLNISRGKLASGKYQHLAQLLDLQVSDTSIQKEEEQYKQIEQPEGTEKPEALKNQSNTSRLNKQIHESQQNHSASPMKKVMSNNIVYPSDNEVLDASNKLKFGQNNESNLQDETNELSPIVPISLSHLFLENKSSKDLPTETMFRNNSGASQGCIFKTPTTLVNIQQSNYVDLISPPCASIPVLLIEDSPNQANMSPDVQINGCRSFNQRCSMLSKEANDAYNKLVLFTNTAKNATINSKLIQMPERTYITIPESPKDQETNNSEPEKLRPCAKNLVNIAQAVSSHLNKEDPGSTSRTTGFIIPQRVIIPGRFNCDPYVSQATRYTVKSSERRHYSAICQIGAHDVWKKDEAVRYDKAYCSFDSLATLQPFGHVDNYVLLVLCRKLFLDCHPVKSKRHCFFSYIGETILKYNGRNGDIVETAFIGANKALKIWRADQLSFPICIEEHWFVFAVCLKAKYFAFLDSLYSSNSDFHIIIDNTLVQNFVKLWELIVSPLMSRPINFNEFQVIYPTVPRQANTDDCGIFAAKVMTLWNPRVNLQNVITSDDVLNLRIKLANEIFFSPHNSIDKTIVSEFFGDVGMH